MGGSGVDPARVAALQEREDAAFVAMRPRSQALWASGQAVMPNGVPMSWLRTSYDHPPLFIESAAGSRLRDVDGHEYADFNIADMWMFTGYGPAPVVEAVRTLRAPPEFFGRMVRCRPPNTARHRGSWPTSSSSAAEPWRRSRASTSPGRR